MDGEIEELSPSLYSTTSRNFSSSSFASSISSPRPSSPIPHSLSASPSSFSTSPSSSFSSPFSSSSSSPSLSSSGLCYALTSSGKEGVGGRRSSSSVLRLMSEWRAIEMDAPEGVSASPSDGENLFTWEASIVGPNETPWEGGIYSLIISVPECYPSAAPCVRFTTEIFHPNVYENGDVCLDILQEQWKPVFTIATILTSLQSLLCDPNPKSPANPQAAHLFVHNTKEYAKRVRRCARMSLGN